MIKDGNKSEILNYSHKIKTKLVQKYSGKGDE